MTLVNIDPHVILHQKMHVSSTGIFVGRSIGLPAPCVPNVAVFFIIHSPPSLMKNGVLDVINA